MEIPIVGPWWPFVLIFLCWLLYLYLTWNYDYWKKRGIPYVKPLPLFGNIMDIILVRRNMCEVYQDLYWKLDGHKFAGLFKLGQPAILIRDPELIKTVLVKDFSSFHDNDIDLDSETDPLFGRNPFVLRGEEWKTTRSLLTPAFTAGKMKPYFPLIAEVCQKFKECIEKSGTAEFEAKELCARFTTDVVASCAFGIQGNALEDPDCEFRRMGRQILEPGFWKNLQFMLFIFFPGIARFLRIGFGNSTLNEFFLRIVREVTTYRQQNNVTRPDYMQYLFSLKHKGKIDEDNATSNGCDPKVPAQQKLEFTDMDMAAQASTFFTDGYETSSVVLSFTLYCLALHPDIQNTLRKEIDSVVKKYGGEITYDGLQEMTYLEMVVSETLRLYPPGTVLSKVCTKPFKLETPSGGEYEIPKGTPVLLPVYAIHKDPKYFPDPDRFDPERFSEENKKNIQRYSYLPFGEGPRICLGFRFALTQVKVGVASVIHNFEVRPNKKTPIPVVPDPFYIILSAKGGLWMDFVKRADK